jgi:hypothetical protein
MKWFVGFSTAVIAAVLVADIWAEIDMRVAANVSLVYMAVGATVFAGRYALWSHWRASQIGPTYLAFKVAMALVLWQIVFAVWVDTDWPGRQHVRFVIYSAGAVAAVVWVATLMRVQKKARQDRL